MGKTNIFIRNERYDVIYHEINSFRFMNNFSYESMVINHKHKLKLVDYNFIFHNRTLLPPSSD